MMRRLLIFAQPVGLVVYTGVQWLLFLYFVQVGGLSLGGDFALAQAVVAPVIALLSFSLRQVWVTGAGSGTGMDYGALVIIRLATTAIAIPLVLIITAAAGLTFNPAPFYLVLLIKGQEAIADILYARLDSERRSAVAGFMMMGKGTVLAAAVAAAWALNLPLATATVTIGAMAIAMLLVEASIVYALRARQPIDLRRSAAAIVPALRPIAWLSAANLLITTAGFLPRYALELFVNREAVGLFTAIAMPASIMILICSGLAQASLHDLAGAVFDRSASRFGRLGARLAGEILAIVAMATLVLWFGGPKLVGLLGRDLSPALAGTMAGVLLIYLPSYAAQALSYIFLALRRYRVLAAINLAALVLQTALAWPLVRFDPIIGAALLAISVSIVQAASFGLLLALHFRSEPPPGDRAASRMTERTGAEPAT